MGILLNFWLESNIITKKVSTDTNIFKKYIDNFNWDELLSKVITTTILLLLVSLLFYIFHYIGKKIIKRAFKKNRLVESLSSGRINTAYALSQNIFHYFILFFYFYAVLSLLGIPIGSLIAGAGIMGVAIGLGAQGFVTDVVTGFFILLEQQFTVGDDVKIGTISGKVAAFGLRTTQILDYDGTLHYIPNRSITIVSNLSRNDMRAQIDIHVKPNQDFDKIKTVIQNVNKSLTPKFDDITQKPQILGVVETPNGLVYRVIIFTKNGAQAPVQRAFLAKYLEALKQAGLEMPISPINLTTK